MITGEDRFDEQSLHGKVIGALAAGATAPIPVLALAGQITLDDPTFHSAGISARFSLADHAGSVGLALATPPTS